MFELSVEFGFVLLVVGIVVAISGSPRVREALLTIFGILGFGLVALGLILFVWAFRSRFEEEVARSTAANRRSIELQTIELGLETLSPGKTSQTKGRAPEKIEKIVAKKPVSSLVASTEATALEATEIEELPLRPAEPIRIDDQTRAEIEQQWREGQLHDRLRYTGTGAATLMCVLATVFGYLKLDMLSRAKHRRGLQAGAAGVILAVALVAALAAEGRLGF